MLIVNSTDECGKKVTLYFGSFNPIHNGHIALAEYILQNTDTDEIWLVISPHNPLKLRSELWNDRLRFELAQLAVANNGRILVSDIEFTLPQPNYTVNTLRILSQLHTDIRFSLLIGADNYIIFDKWCLYEEILDKYSIYVYPRDGIDFDLNKFPQMHWLNAPVYPISSTMIRNLLAADCSITGLVPQKVEKRILEVFHLSDNDRVCNFGIK